MQTLPKVCPVCKSNSIHEINFPPRKERPEKKERVKKERTIISAAAKDAVNTTTIEKDASVDVIELAKKASKANSKEQKSEDKG